MSEFLSRPDFPVMPRSKANAFAAAVLAGILGIQGGVRDVYAQEGQRDVRVLVEHEVEREKIAALERSFADLGSRILPYLDKYVVDENLKRLIRGAFDQVAKNSRNPRRLNPSNGVLAGPTEDFFYAFNNRGWVRFEGKKRTISLPEDFNPKEFGDLLSLLHETIHLLHDNARRQNMNPQEYLKGWGIENAGNNTICVVDEEALGFASGMEVLNILMSGRLRKQPVLRDRHVAEMVRRPQARQDLIRVASVYFENDAGAFRRLMERSCRDAGATILDMKLKPIE